SSFGNWRIVKTISNNTLNLIGSTSKPTPGHFFLKCGEELSSEVYIPLFELDKNAPPITRITVTLWNEKSTPVDLPLLVFQNVMALESDSPSNRFASGVVKRFGSVLRSSEK